MRLQVSPERVELGDIREFEVLITVTNTGTVIGGYHLRILGADPSWVTLESENLSLFPDTSQSVRAMVRIPPGLGAGERRIAVQVRELTPPQAISVAEIELVVPAKDALRLQLLPTTVVGGRSGRFGLQAENIGNTRATVLPIGLDAEEKVTFAFSPSVLDLAPGEHASADIKASARRRWFGNPVVRQFGIAVVPAVVPTEPTGPAEPPEPLATGSLVQKPRLGRGLLSLLSLLLALSVFAAVITIALSRLVGVSAADRDLAIQVAAAQQNAGGSGAGSKISGTAVLITDGQPADGVTVEVFAAGSLTTPLTSTATGKDGAFTFTGLSAGGYKLRFRGAGFTEIWYPSALTGEAAQVIDVQPGKDATNITVRLGGLPATLSGEVVGDDVAGALLTVRVPLSMLATTKRTGSGSAAPTVTAAPAGSAAPTAAASPENAGSAVLTTVPIGSDGTFLLTDLASPFEYQLEVTKPGYIADTQIIDLAGGENRTGVQLRLRTGDGLISGVILGPDGPIGNAVVTATTGTDTVSTVSQTKGTKGAFTLRGLVTPGNYTLTVTATGFATQTSTVSLVSAQQLTDVRVNLTKSTGAISGVVSTVPDVGSDASAGTATGAAGVTVSVGVGDATVQTVSQSTGTVGSWTVAGLPLPGTFTVTFTRADLQSQTLVVSLDAAGSPSTGQDGLNVAMRSAYGTVHGTVRQARSAGAAAAPVGEATVTLASGSDTYTVTTASTPSADTGTFRIDAVRPGSYTLTVSRPGTSPTVLTLSVAAGRDVNTDPVLVQPAGITGTVTTQDGSSPAGLQVVLYESSQYPLESVATTTADKDGNYRFDNVDAPQIYVIEVRSAVAGPLTSGTLRLEPSTTGTLNLTVPSVTGTAATTAGGG
jgi:5-hydroxyisourate hydrolase-like protein (transthyretin family)